MKADDIACPACDGQGMFYESDNSAARTRCPLCDGAGIFKTNTVKGKACAEYWRVYNVEALKEHEAGLRRAEQRNALRKTAIDKLTPEESAALGIKEG